ncbi:MAG: beta-galactosidase trimerization domain-containing protein [Clostridia bacterium]|nr:beta-galactosidase trimerization domain-containing protein [Clostridia bacterium]MBQ8859667.1 beta-galactosidase trimerization domain-containing protein [Clostridia bacterium]
MKEKWWVREQPLLINAIQIRVKKGDEAAVREYVAPWGFDTEQLYYALEVGDEKNGKMVYYDEKKHGTVLEEHLRVSKQFGLREIVYTNNHVINYDIAQEHPEYSQIKKDGTPMMAYGDYNLVCVRPGGAFHRAMIEDIRGLCSHDIDGIFLDGPLMFEGGCYCPTCQAAFEKKYGHSIYEGTAIELREARLDAVTDHIREIRETIDSVNPDVLLYCNNSALRPDVTGNNTRRVYDYVDLLGAEAGFFIPTMTFSGMWQASAFMKHLEGIVGDPRTAGKPMVNFFSDNENGWTDYMHTPEETKVMYQRTLANGANVWFGVHFDPMDALQFESLQAVKRLNALVKNNKDIFKPSKTCARVALMWSEDTANNYSSSIEESDFTAGGRSAGFAARGDHRAAFFAAVDALSREHIQYDVVDETGIREGRLASYGSLILPGVACMSGTVASAVIDYVKDGGAVLGNFDVAMYDELGCFRGQSALSEIFGFRGEAKIMDAENAYMYREGEHPLLENVTNLFTPTPRLAAEWQFDEKTNVLMKSTYPMVSRYGIMDKENKFPAVTERACGKGTAYYVCGTWGETRTERNQYDFGCMTASFCRATSAPVVTSEGVGLYELVLRRQADRFLLHVVNMTGEMERPMRARVPLRDIKVKLNLDGFDVKKDAYVVSTICGTKLEDLEVNGQEISFTIPALAEYEVVVIG